MAPARFMAKLRFGVFQLNNEWRLWCHNHHLGRFESRAAAISAGESAADQASGSGFDVELHAMDLNGELRLTYSPASRENGSITPSPDGRWLGG